MVFSANDTLNGKLMVQFKNIVDAELVIYRWPKHWNQEKYNFHGIFENGFTSQRVYPGGITEVPTDWIVMIAYHNDYWAGKLELDVWAEPWNADDIEDIARFQPTGTTYVNHTKIEEERKAREAKILAE